MKTPNVTDVKKGIAVLWESLQCPICLDIMATPVSTKCDHRFCKFCMVKLLDNSKQNKTNCPVCKSNITKRSLQESPGFQRLVTGLQDMIKAYEHDTGTNYFTGAFMEGKQSSVTHQNTKNSLDSPSEDTTATELDMENVNRADPPLSNNSTVEAQKEFASLMGLEDSEPIPTEIEGLDSGLGDAPPTSEKKTSSSVEHLNEENADASDNIAPEPQTKIKRSLRRKQKKDSEPERVFERKKKKSLEKVAEWLMKVPITGDEELENPQENTDDSDCCSSTSTLDVKLHNKEMNSKQEDGAKALEDQVFGAVYKRKERKQTAPSLLKLFDESLPSSSKTTEMHTRESVFKVGKDFGHIPTEEQEKGSRSDQLKEVEWMEVEQLQNTPKVSEEVNAVTEIDKTIHNHVAPSYESDIFPHERVNGSKKRSRNTQRLLDGDFQGVSQIKPEVQKQTLKKNRKNKKSDEKTASGPKPLVLVGVQNMETSPKVRERTEETQVQIENYPSSEDQEPVAKSKTRKSRRLQDLTKEVLQSNKRSKLKGADMHETVERKSVDTQAKTVEDASLLTINPSAKGNGCVFDQDLGAIVIIETEKRKSSPTSGEVKESDPKNLCEPGEAPCVTVVPSSICPSEVGPSFEDVSTNPSPAKIQQEASASEAKRAETENEEEKNDSELDTEQLLKSFKSTKRKTFYLGDPAVKKSRLSGKEESENNERKETFSENADVSKETQKSSCSDYIRPTNSPTRMSKAVFTKPEKVMEKVYVPESSQDSAGNYVSSGLSPNKVSKVETGTPPRSVVPRVGDSGLCFTPVDCEESGKTPIDFQTTENQLEHSQSAEANITEIRNRISVDHPDLSVQGLGSPTANIEASESLCNSFAQVVPEGKSNTDNNGEICSLSPIKSNMRAKRRAQKLESSESDSSESEEELPSLRQILGTTTRLSPGNQVQENQEAEMVTPPPASPNPDSVNSSQASVDLFGTPEECDVQANANSVSMELSQFSSEVLVTQQKVEMKKELVRLEKLMALVSEVLQEKEGSPAREVPPETPNSTGNPSPDALKPPVSSQELHQGSGRTEDPDLTRNTNMGPSQDKAKATESNLLKDDSIMENDSTAKVTQVSKTTPTTSATKCCVSPSDGQEDKENDSPPKDSSKVKFVLVTSGLGPNDQILVKKFAKRVGALVVSQVTREATHVIMHTDERLVCERTLKYFLGIAGRKWVVSSQWISECFKQKKLIDERPYEVRGDVVNGPNHQGPMKARSTKDNNLLMKGLTICFQGPFTDMTTEEMEFMAKLCGAKVVKDPLLLDGEQKSCQLVIIQPRSDSSSSTYSSLSRRVTVLTRGWLLDTVATYTLQNYNNYHA